MKQTVDHGPCSIPGCERRRFFTKDYCRPHYRSFLNYGDPLRAVPMKDENHYAWKGDQAGYAAIHTRLRKYRGRADVHVCVECGAPAKGWAYDRLDPDERTETGPKGGTLTFSVNLDHYQPMCDSCHGKLDQGARPKPETCPRGHPWEGNRRPNRRGSRCAVCHREDERQRYRNLVGTLTRKTGGPTFCPCGRGPFVGALGLAQHRRHCDQ